MASTPRVTVFIPVYNRKHYITTAVESILAQTYTDFELLVLDDGSTDGTLDALANCHDPRLRLERNPRNLGLPSTRNRGLELAQGEYIALLDSDDKAWPQRLARQVAVLDQRPDLVQIGAACDFMDAEGRLRSRVRRRPLDADEVAASLLFYCAMTNRTLMGRTAILRQYGYSTDFPSSEDYELHLRLSRRYRMANLPDVLSCGREHDGRFTQQNHTLGYTCKREIARRALQDIGINAAEDDLDRHYALSRPRELGEHFDRTYLDWAEHWLAQLQQANQQTQRYEAKAFHRVVADQWLALCLQARKPLGNTAYRYLLHSPLVHGIPDALWRAWHKPKPCSAGALVAR